MQCRAYPFLVPCNLTWMGEDASLRNPALPSFSWEHGSDYIVTRSHGINCLKRPSLYLLDSLLKEVCIMSAFLSVPHLWACSGWESIWVSHNLTFFRAKDSPLNIIKYPGQLQFLAYAGGLKCTFKCAPQMAIVAFLYNGRGAMYGIRSPTSHRDANSFNFVSLVGWHKATISLKSAGLDSTTICQAMHIGERTLLTLQLKPSTHTE